MRRLASTVLITGALIALLGSSTAQAVVSYGLASEFGSGVLGDPTAAAVDGASGNLLAVAPANNSVQVYDLGGSSPSLLTTFGADQLVSPYGIAIDQVNGDAYIGNSSFNEVQVVTIGGFGGTFTLGFEGQSTGPIPYDASGRAIEEALEGLPGIGAGNVSVGTSIQPSLNSAEVIFRGALKGTDVEQLSGDGGGLQSGPDEVASLSISTVQVGAPGSILKFTPDNRAQPTSYTEDPTFVSPVRGADAEAGQIGNFRSQLAVDPGSGELLIADTGNNQVSRFASNGAFLDTFDGTSSKAAAFTSLLDLAVGPDSQIYVIRDGLIQGGVSGARVESFAPDGTASQSFGPEELGGARSIAFDPSLGNLIVASQEPAQRPLLNVYHDGALIDKFYYPGFYWGPVAIDLVSDGQASSHLYGLPAAGDSVRVLHPISVPTLDVPSGLKMIGPNLSTAHLEGTVNPRGKPAKYHFEYFSRRTFTWTSTPEADAGSGFGPVSVAAEPPLPIDTDYEVRLVLASNGTEMSSPIRLFSAAHRPTAVTTRADHLLAGNSAMLHGLINPRGFATGYRFEYGTSTGYGLQTPVLGAEGKALLGVFQRISGLQPATTYHYRLLAESPVGPEVGEDKTFTTPPALQFAAPGRVAGASSPPVSVAKKAKRCAKGRQLRRVKGKVRCVEHRKHHRPKR